MKFTKLASLLICSGILMANAQAQESPTLKRIKESGKITLGVRDASIPFSYLDDKQSYQGYSIDLCRKVVNHIQKQLNLTTLIDVKLNPVTSATRIPLMMNGTIDLECGSTTNNEERQKQVSFAPTTFVTANRILSKKASNVKTLADLKGKPVVSTSGTSNLKQLTQLNADQNLGITVMPAKDHAEAFLMVETGRAVAWVMDDILLMAQAANSKNPNDYEISKEALSVEPYGIMMRKDDPEFKKAVDSAIKSLMMSGEINTIYNKWFMQPIPPKNITLNLAMSDQLKAVIAKPTDSGNPAAYAVVPEAQKAILKKKK